MNTFARLENVFVQQFCPIIPLYSSPRGIFIDTTLRDSPIQLQGSCRDVVYTTDEPGCAAHIAQEHINRTQFKHTSPEPELIIVRVPCQQLWISETSKNTLTVITLRKLMA